MRKKKGLKKVCKLGELKTTSSVHYTIKGLSFPGKPKITPKKKKNQTQNAEDLSDGRLYVIRAKETSCGRRKVQGVKARVEKKRRRLHVMSSAKGFFFLTLPLQLCPGCFLILRFTARGYCCSQTLLSSSERCSDRTAAAVNYSARTPMPQSTGRRLAGVPSAHCFSFFPQKYLTGSGRNVSSCIFHTLEGNYPRLR